MLRGPKPISRLDLDKLRALCATETLSLCNGGNWSILDYIHKKWRKKVGIDLTNILRLTTGPSTIPAKRYG